MSTQAITRGAHHVGLTVLDLEAAKNFFLDKLGYTQVGEKPEYPAALVTDGITMITLWRAADPANATPFDRKNVIGLHHLALRVDNHAALDDLYASLRSADDVTIEFAPEQLGAGTARHMMTNIPSGIRVEFISPSE